jgi:hypothetical protein
MVQVWGHLLQNFLWFPPNWKEKALLKELEVDGRTIFEQKDLSHYITKFYANLYALEAHASGTMSHTDTTMAGSLNV